MVTFSKNIVLCAFLSKILPQELLAALRQAVGEAEEAMLEEVRLRAGRTCSVTVAGENRPLAFRIDGKELSELLALFCRGSVYAYRDTLREGYVPLPGGARLGVAGRAVTEGTTLCAVGEVSSLCLRMPHRVRGAASAAIRAWEALGRRCGMLVCAPPGAGKTTLLRDFIAYAAGGERPMRAAVVDSRGELCPDGEGEYADVLFGYPRAQGMEIALRTLSPEVIVCDEIGAGEVGSVLRVCRSGVPLIASVHALSSAELARRPGGQTLLSCGAFGLLCTIERRGGERLVRTEALPCCV